jgi:hypothetical protein
LLYDLVLELEDVGCTNFAPIGLQLSARLRIDELHGDAQPISTPSDRALNNLADAKLFADLTDVDEPTLVGKGRLARDHEEFSHAGKG